MTHMYMYQIYFINFGYDILFDKIIGKSQRNLENSSLRGKVVSEFAIFENTITIVAPVGEF